MELKALTYTSLARPGLLAEDVDAIISSSRINNPLDGITGILIFNGSAFMQMLEGSEAAAPDLAERLIFDQRHTDVSVRDEKLITARSFPDWSMAYLRLSNGQFEGAENVERALKRNLPPLLHNVLMDMTQEIIRADL